MKNNLLKIRITFAILIVILGFQLFALVKHRYSNISVSNPALISAASSFRFVAWADSRDGYGVLANESNAIKNLIIAPNFTIFSGDLCGSFDVNCINNSWKPAVGSILSKTFVTRGNHDNGSIGSWQSLFNTDNTASKVGASNYSEQTASATYSFDYGGNSHFVVIDLPGGNVGSMTNAEIAWLDNDLKLAEARLGAKLQHEFLFWHGPIYGVTDQHGNDKPTDKLINILNAHPLISAGFFGHEHVSVYAHLDNSRVSGLNCPFEEFIIGRAGAPGYNVTKSVNFSTGDAFALVNISGKDFTVSIIKSDGSQVWTHTFTESGTCGG